MLYTLLMLRNKKSSIDHLRCNRPNAEQRIGLLLEAYAGKDRNNNFPHRGQCLRMNGTITFLKITPHERKS